MAAAARPLGDEPPQLFGEVLNDDELRRARCRLAFVDHNEVLAVRRDVIAGSSSRVEGLFEQEPRLSQPRCVVQVDVDRHHLAAIAVEQLSALGVPDRIGATFGRDLPFGAGIVKRSQIDLGPARLIGLMGSFGPQQVITTQADGVRSVYATDLDGDGAADALSASWIDHKIAWYENQILTDCNGNGIPDDCDIATGTSTDFNGNGIPDECECMTENYCITTPNSTGLFARISSDGLPRLSVNAFSLTANGLPPSQFGVFFFGPLQVEIPFGDGFRCVGGQLTRLDPPVQFDPSGLVQRQLDFTQSPLSGFLAGDTTNFQLWYRDPQPVGFGFNLTNALEVTLCP